MHKDLTRWINMIPRIKRERKNKLKIRNTITISPLNVNQQGLILRYKD